MTKISFIVVIWGWLCVVYGQLPFSYRDYHSYYNYNPYTSNFFNHPITQTNDKTGAHLVGNGVTPNTKAIIDVAIFFKIQQLEGTIAGLTSDLKAMNDQLNNKADRLALSITNEKVLAVTRDVDALKSPSSINKMPTSCGDLKDIGFVKSGVYTVIVPNQDSTVSNRQVADVYCDFTKPNDAGLQKSIGYVNVKTMSVYFYAQRSGLFTTVDAVIPFDSILINVGGAMDTSSGIFKAPTPGKYFFAYTGLSWDSEAKIQLQIKTVSSGRWVAAGEAHSSPLNALALQSASQLAQDDQVQIVLLQGAIHDQDGNHFSQFFGWLLEEDLNLPV